MKFQVLVFDFVRLNGDFQLIFREYRHMKHCCPVLVYAWKYRFNACSIHVWILHDNCLILVLIFGGFKSPFIGFSWVECCCPVLVNARNSWFSSCLTHVLTLFIECSILIWVWMILNWIFEHFHELKRCCPAFVFGVLALVWNLFLHNSSLI